MSNFKAAAKAAQTIGDLIGFAKRTSLTSMESDMVEDLIEVLMEDDEVIAAIEADPELRREALQAIRKGQEFLITPSKQPV